MRRAKEERTFSRKYTIQRWKANWVGHVVRRNCPLKLVIEGKIELTGRRWRRHKHLLDDLKEREKLLEFEREALIGSLWRIRFERGCEPVARQTTVWMNEFLNVLFTFLNMYSPIFLDFFLLRQHSSQQWLVFR